MKLGDGVEQAIHCTVMLSGLPEGGLLSAQSLAEFHGVSPSYLLKHLQALSSAGIVRSVPGPSGGYRLNRPASEISLLDVVSAVEGPEPAFRCGEIRQRGPDPLPKECYRAPCAINAAMLRAEAAWRRELERIKIADLARRQDTPVGRAIEARSKRFLGQHQR